MKKYKKNDLRLALQAKMGQPVSENEFARWFGIYCDMTAQPDTVQTTRDKKFVFSFVGYQNHSVRLDL